MAPRAIGALAGAALLALFWSAPARAQDHVWRVGTLAAKSDVGFVMMAARRGFGEAQGLKIEMIESGGGDALLMKALIAGELDAYEASPGIPIIAASRGADVKILGCYWQVLTYGIFARAGIDGPAQVKGKRFAISAPGALPDLLARAYLDANGIKGDEVAFAVLGGDAERFKALGAGLIDLTASSSEFVPFAGAQKVSFLAHAADFAPNYLRVCTITTGKEITARREDATRYVAAQISAQRYALTHRDEELSLTRELTGVKPEDPRPAYIFDEVVRLHAIAPELPLSLEKLAWMQALLLKTGNLAKPFDLAALVDGSIREAALKRLPN